MTEEPELLTLDEILEIHDDEALDASGGLRRGSRHDASEPLELTVRLTEALPSRLAFFFEYRRS